MNAHVHVYLGAYIHYTCAYFTDVTQLKDNSLSLIETEPIVNLADVESFCKGSPPGIGIYSTCIN